MDLITHLSKKPGRPSKPVGTETVSRKGYILVKVSDNPHRWETKHRLVMQKHLGRELNQDEEVSFIDGDKTNTKIGNLYIIASTGKAICSSCGKKLTKDKGH
jgi:hypothetical protein